MALLMSQTVTWESSDSVFNLPLDGDGLFFTWFRNLNAMSPVEKYIQDNTKVHRELMSGHFKDSQGNVPRVSIFFGITV